MAMRFRFLCAIAGMVGLVLVPASAGAGTSGRLGVHSASLTQDGRQLVWHVQLTGRFSPAGLAHDGDSLCLAFESLGHGGVTGLLCVTASPRGRAELLYTPVRAGTRGPARAVRAVLSRTGPFDLTATFMPSAVGRSYASSRWQVLSSLGSPTIPYPTRPALATFHTPRLVGCVPSGQPLAYSGPDTRRVIALTFDDGPWTDTPQFLDVLEREHVHATFFQIGRQISTYGESVDRRMLADGDMIGDHTWSHVNVSGAGQLAAAQIAQAAAAIKAATGGFQPCLFRSPGGALSPALISEARSMGFTTIQWDVDPRDWARPGVGAIYANVVAHARPGAIVIQHDGGGDRSQTLAALPQEIHTLRDEGYQFVTVTQLLGQRLLYK
jgi:peptidoglycan/xylan/chitin deacetylase (PgdA/CDA1 family)